MAFHSGEGARTTMVRQALHAWRLAFEHPITSQRIDLTSALPEDMDQALQNSGLSYNLTP